MVPFFFTKPSSKSKWPNYSVTFSISQNIRDLGLLNRIITTLGCGTIKSGGGDMKCLCVNNKQELNEIRGKGGSPPRDPFPPFLYLFSLNIT